MDVPLLGSRVRDHRPPPGRAVSHGEQRDSKQMQVDSSAASSGHIRFRGGRPSDMCIRNWLLIVAERGGDRIVSLASYCCIRSCKVRLPDSSNRSTSYKIKQLLVLNPWSGSGRWEMGWDGCCNWCIDCPVGLARYDTYVM